MTPQPNTRVRVRPAPELVATGTFPLDTVEPSIPRLAGSRFALLAAAAAAHPLVMVLQAPCYAPRRLPDRF